MIKNNRVNIVKSIRKQSDFSFSKNTTYGCGGNARIAYYPESIRQATSLFDYLKDSATPFIVLGNGSNVLASSAFFDGAIISTRQFDKINKVDNVLYCESGVTVKRLLNYCIEEGLSGIEYLAGIPASIGGLAYMNAGTFNKHISENIINVRLYDGKYIDLLNKNCNFGNKYSIMRDINALILNIGLKLAQSDSKKVQANIEHYLNLRKTQPKGKSCGCIFKNPQGFSAGKLIDDCGLKGFSIGGAKVSLNHANFIINDGATPEEVYSLISVIKSKVYNHFSILLEEEVIYIGEFNATDS